MELRRYMPRGIPADLGSATRSEDDPAGVPTPLTRARRLLQRLAAIR